MTLFFLITVMLLHTHPFLNNYPASAISALDISVSTIVLSDYTPFFQFWSELLLGVILMVWCLMTRWPGGYLAYHLAYNRTTTHRIFGLCLISVIFFMLLLYYSVVATSSHIGRWSLFINTPYALTSKFVLIFFVAASLINRVLVN